MLLAAATSGWAAPARASQLVPLTHRAAPPAAALYDLRHDLQRDDWTPLETTPRWRNPCFFSSWLTALSVQQAAAHGLWPTFGLGPLLVLLSSLLYWRSAV